MNAVTQCTNQRYLHTVVPALNDTRRWIDTMAILNNLLCCLLITIWTKHVFSATLPFERKVNEQTIMDLAEKSNKTLLKLIGLAIQNLRCDLEKCNNWSEWTSDALYKGQFGVKTRSRDCWYDTCDKTGDKVVENDSKLFEGKCPISYNITDGKYCMAYFQTGLNHSAAHQLCAKDGGHIINVDTKERYDLALKYSSSGKVHIKGERQVPGGPFFDDAGNSPEERPFFKWASGFPNNSSTRLCLVLSSLGGQDKSCSSGYYVLCEIPQ